MKKNREIIMSVRCWNLSIDESWSLVWVENIIEGLIPCSQREVGWASPFVVGGTWQGV